MTKKVLTVAKNAVIVKQQSFVLLSGCVRHWSVGSSGIIWSYFYCEDYSISASSLAYISLAWLSYAIRSLDHRPKRRHRTTCVWHDRPTTINIEQQTITHKADTTLRLVELLLTLSVSYDLRRVTTIDEWRTVQDRYQEYQSTSIADRNILPQALQFYSPN